MSVGKQPASTLAGQYGVQGFPSLKFMYHDGSKIKALDYNGGRTAADIINFAMVLPKPHLSHSAAQPRSSAAPEIYRHSG
jgi:hypothetical protein